MRLDSAPSSVYKDLLGDQGDVNLVNFYLSFSDLNF